MKERILIVDDNQRNITVLGTILHQENYQLNIAMDGLEALEMVKKAQPDLILLDIMMPNMDGYETCEHLKNDPNTREIPVIFLTAKTQLEDKVKGLDLGAVDYVSKPFESRELLSRVRTHLDLKRHKDLLKESNQRNLELLHVLCHDIANPLSLIIGYLSLLANAPDKFPQFEKVLNIAAENGLEIIDVARKMLSLDSSGIDLSPTSLDQAVNKAVELIENRLEEKDIKLNLNLTPIMVLSDEASLVNSVILNLLTNAIKFSYRGGEVDINVIKYDPDTALLQIIDHGMGMPEHILSGLFNINAKVHRPGTEEEGGTGFAMPLIKKFVDAYDATLKITSQTKEEHPDQSGTQFDIYFKIVIGN